jgi:pyruvate/2-oxoglutarate/acetoin dehydrogenase E1 component
VEVIGYRAFHRGNPGKAHVPIVICAKQGVAGNLSHVRGFNSWLIHVPGLKVVAPATPRDARGLWKSAIGDVTVIAAGETVRLALEAAAQLAGDGIEAVVIVHSDWKIGGFGAEIAATIGERAHAALRTWIRRVAPPHQPPPFRRELEEAFLPSVDGVVSAVREVLRD